MTPFANETDVVNIGTLTFENRTDRVSMFGSLDFTLDRQGVERLDQVLAMLTAIRSACPNTLPQSLVPDEPVSVSNPFN